MGNATEEVLMADKTARLISREEVAEGTMAFHFEKPSGFSFRAGQFADVTQLRNTTMTGAYFNKFLVLKPAW